MQTNLGGDFLERLGNEATSGFGKALRKNSSATRVRRGAAWHRVHYWIVDQKIIDLSAYGKFVDNISQNFGAVTVSLGTQSITVQGIG